MEICACQGLSQSIIFKNFNLVVRQILTTWEKQILARAIGIQKENGGNNAFFIHSCNNIDSKVLYN